MSDIDIARDRIAWPRAGTLAAGRLDTRRALQLALAGIWLFDGILQYQSFMYTTAFSQSLAETADGNPGFIARPIVWSADLLSHHLVLLNTSYATVQVLLGLGIAYRRTVRAGLTASVAWSLAVWWLGEGLGGVLNGGASPLNGAPGGVLFYALLAVLLWPSRRPADQPPEFIAARSVGARAARALWLVLWLSLAWFALTPANRAPQGLSGMIAGMEDGEPGWLAALDRGAASVLAGHGLAASVVLAAALAVIAIGVYLPRRASAPILVSAIVLAGLIWVFGEAFGEIFTGSATDPNSGPLLVLLIFAYWPPRTDG